MQLEVLQFFGDRLDLFHDAVDLFDDTGVEPFGDGPFLKGKVAQVEQADRFIDQLQGVVVVLTQGVAVDAFVDVEQLAHGGGDLFTLVEHFLEIGEQVLGIGVEDVGDHDRVMGDRGPARLGDDVGALDPGLVADVLHLVDDVVGILLDGVVDGREIAGLGAVVINTQASADVEELDADTHLAHFAVDAGPFDQGGLDLVDLGDLAADVGVEQLDALQHAVFLQKPDGGDDLGHAQAELGVVAAGGGPFAGPLGGELYPDAQFGHDAGLLCQLDDLFQFEELLDDDGDVVADLGGVENRLDVFGILVAVADDRQAVAGGDCDSGHQLRLGADFQADVVAFAVVGDGLNHLALLVHLDRVEGLVFCRVVVLGDGALEHTVDGGDASLEHIHETEQDRRLDLALDQVVNQGAQIDGILGVG